jgi:hypothetical protein
MDRFGGAMRGSVLLPLLFGCAAAAAAAIDPVTEFRQAFPGDQSQAKRQAIDHLAASQLPDEVVLPLLVAAVDDRQAHQDAVDALRRRTGLQPSPYLGQSHYPSYPPSDHPLSWQYWLRDWQREHAQERRIDITLQRAREADAAATRMLERAQADEAR